MSDKPTIQFYHLLATSLHAALPKLLERAFQSALRTRIVATDEAQCRELDELLWHFDPKSFLPHGTSNDALPAKQPILISTSTENINQASLVVIVNGAMLHDALQEQQHITRVFDIFDGADEDQVAAARTRWKSYMDEGYGLRYIQQNDAGGWDVKKEVDAKP